ncbi:MAG TPA: HisA/HisF-related TIM barrel protein [Longimicrobiales bacterium]
MEVIPALDLRGGCAVHADGGDRSRYPVVEGVLGSGTDPVALATRFRDRLGCATVYVADLDAIAGLGHSRDIVARLAATGLALVVDAGIRTPDAAAALLDAGAARVVVALETLRSMDELGAIVRAVGPERVTFSLDLRAGRPISASPALAGSTPVALAAAAAERGARQLILLDLARVGQGLGPPLDLLRRLRARLPDIALIAGGGVAGPADLDALSAVGCAAAIVGTAIHRGRITRADVARLAVRR